MVYANAQRANYSKRRKEIWEALHPEPSVDYGREDGGEAETEVAHAPKPKASPLPQPK